MYWSPDFISSAILADGSIVEDFHTENGEVCPAGWNKGDDGMHENANSVAEYLSKNISNL